MHNFEQNGCMLVGAPLFESLGYGSFWGCARLRPSEHILCAPSRPSTRELARRPLPFARFARR